MTSKVLFVFFLLRSLQDFFHTVHGVLKARILKWFVIPFSSGPRFVKSLHILSELLNCGVGENSRVPQTASSNQPILKEINPEYSFGRTDAEA